MLVVKLLEMIDVHDRNGVWRFETHQCVVEGATRRQCRQLVVIGKKIRCLNDGKPQDECSSRKIRRRNPTGAAKECCQEKGTERPQQTAFYGPMEQKESR